MRTVNLTIIICLITFQGYAQYSLAHPTSESSYLHEFYSTETLVPIVGIDSIDAKIKKTLEDYWTFTKLKFVPLDELDEIQYVSRINLLNYPFASLNCINRGFERIKFSIILLKLPFGWAFLLNRKMNSLM